MKESRDVEFAKKLFLQIVNAIKYCHELHIVHRDLKPENIVFFAHDLVKLTDFGLSANCRPGEKLQTLCGSLEYSAPEIFLGESYDGPAVGELTPLSNMELKVYNKWDMISIRITYTIELGYNVPGLVRTNLLTKFIKPYVFLCKLNSVSTYTR